MKKILFATLIFASIIGCSSDKKNIQGTWIMKYKVNHFSPVDKDFESMVSPRIFTFSKDSLEIFRFPSYSFGISYSQDTFAYEIIQNDVLIPGAEILDTMRQLKISADSFSFFYQDQFYRYIDQETLDTSQFVKEIFCQRLPAYKQFKNEKQLINLLTSSTFEIEDYGVRIEFLEDNTFYISDLSGYGLYFHIWYTFNYQEELFFVLEDFKGSGLRLHIENFDEEKISATHYSKENINVNFKKLPDKKIHRIADLIGRWEEIKEDLPPLPPPPVTSNVNEFVEKEIFEVSDTLIFSAIGHERDTFSWITNKYQDQFIFPKRSKEIGDKQWNILSVNENELLIERWVNRPDFPGGKREEVKFRRIN